MRKMQAYILQNLRKQFLKIAFRILVFRAVFETPGDGICDPQPQSACIRFGAAAAFVSVEMLTFLPPDGRPAQGFRPFLTENCPLDSFPGVRNPTGAAVGSHPADDFVLSAENLFERGG